MTDGLYNVIIKLEGALGIAKYVNGSIRDTSADKKATEFIIDPHTVDEIIIGTNYPLPKSKTITHFIELCGASFFRKTDYITIWEDGEDRVRIYTPVQANIGKMFISSQQNGRVPSSVSLKPNEVARYHLTVYENSSPIVTVKLEPKQL